MLGGSSVHIPMHVCLWFRHCDRVNDFPVVNGTLLTNIGNFPYKRSTVLVFSTCNTVDFWLGKLHLLFLIFY